MDSIINFDNQIKEGLASLEFLLKIAELNDNELNSILKNGR